MRRFLAVGFVFWCMLLAVPGQAAAQVAVQEGTLQQREARPGETYAGTIVVTNVSDVPQAVRLYQTDYRFYADGRAVYGEPGTDPRSNARWITLNPSAVTVPPRSQATVQYTVQVPGDSARRLAGSYWSVIMVEPVEPASALAAQGAPGLRIVTRIRYGVQVVTHIAGTGVARLDFDNPGVVYGEGGRVLEFDMRNTGDRSVPLKVRLELFDAAGERVLSREASVRILHPGTSVRQRFPLGVPSGRTYEAMVTADTGDNVFGAQYTLRL